MSAKEVALDVINRMPEGISWEELMEELEIGAAQVGEDFQLFHEFFPGDSFWHSVYHVESNFFRRHFTRP